MKFKATKLLEALDELLAMLMPLDGAPLTEERIYQLCDDCLQSKAPQPLIRALGEAFTQPAILARCFQSKHSQDSDSSGGKNTGLSLILSLEQLLFQLHTIFVRALDTLSRLEMPLGLSLIIIFI